MTNVEFMREVRRLNDAMWEQMKKLEYDMQSLELLLEIHERDVYNRLGQIDLDLIVLKEVIL